MNFAAESHNSLAVLDPTLFFRTNVLGTQILLEAARQLGVERFHHVSTCEVYGDLALDSDEVFTEETPYQPRTPYNASKAGADHAVRAYSETYGLPVTITNCSNNYGPYQFPEKVIPLFVTNALDDVGLPMYESTANKREWLHVLDHCRAIELVLQRRPDRRDVQRRLRCREEHRGDCRAGAGADGKAREPEDDRAGSTGSRSPVPARFVQAPLRARLDADDRVREPGSSRQCAGTRRTESGGRQ